MKPLKKIYSRLRFSVGDAVFWSVIYRFEEEDLQSETYQFLADAGDEANAQYLVNLLNGHEESIHAS